MMNKKRSKKELNISIAREWAEWFKYNKGREFGVDYECKLDKEPIFYTHMKKMVDPLGGNSAAFFILDENKEIIRVSNLKKWGEWMGNNKIIKTSIHENCMTETLFIGFDEEYHYLRDKYILFIEYNSIRNQEGVYKISDVRYFKTYEEALKAHTSRINDYRKYFKLNSNCCFFKKFKNMEEFKDILRECPNRKDKKANCVMYEPEGKD